MLRRLGAQRLDGILSVTQWPGFLPHVYVSGGVNAVIVGTVPVDSGCSADTHRAGCVVFMLTGLNYMTVYQDTSTNTRATNVSAG